MRVKIKCIKKEKLEAEKMTRFTFRFVNGENEDFTLHSEDSELSDWNALADVEEGLEFDMDMYGNYQRLLIPEKA